MGECGVLHCYVFDEDNEPIPGVYVEAYDLDGNWIDTEITNDEGACKIEMYKGNRCKVNFWQALHGSFWYGYKPDFVTASTLRVNRGEELWIYAIMRCRMTPNPL